MKLNYSMLTLLASMLCSPFVQAAGQHGNWSLNEAENAAAGISGTSISSQSKEALQGSGKTGKIELGYSCNGDFYLLANDMGFAIDRVDCGPYGCKKRQYGQIQFDKKPVTDAEFEIMSNSKGMYLLSDKTMLVNAMKAGNNVHLTLKLAHTDGKEQTATFSLKGFTAAYNWCGK
ncbi:MAG TPA: hypothetical protein ENJ65_03960 [Candidatus Tenderia electrophaga]|uniref:Uncharacterized protein n=1 Tax=Candidatus Tenderia electrophaga TaxID=1748243 RepID=A0A832J381_9GAMM|nr:hypothetical protein [Candidatus Tenderia electrophaga]